MKVLTGIFICFVCVPYAFADGSDWETRWTVTVVNYNNCAKILCVDAYQDGALYSKSFTQFTASANAITTVTIIGSGVKPASDVVTLGLSWSSSSLAVIVNGILPNSGWQRTGDPNYPYISGSSYIAIGTPGSCTTNVAVFGVQDSNDGVPTRNQPPNNPDCVGMPVWSVSEPYISLWLKDEPLGYQPALGPRVSFELAFNQREYVGGLHATSFSLGKKWDSSWLSFVVKDYNTNNVVYFPGGGSVTYYTTNDYLTQTTLTGDTTNGFTLYYPDGSKDVYGYVVTNGSGIFLEAFLTQRWNPQAQKTTLNYFTYTPGAPVIRLKNMVDGDGRTNTITYATNNVYSTNLIAKVTDPFGRSATFSYDSNGHLTNMVDVMTNSTSFNYDTNDWVTNMITPYGTTSFMLTDSGTSLPPNGRSVLITRPDNSHEYYLYQDNAPGIASAYPTNQVPSVP